MEEGEEKALALVEVVEAHGDMDAAEDAKGAAATAVFLDQSGIVHPGLAPYFNSRMFSDVNVLTPDGRRLACHQVVLSAGSKRFAKILEQGILQADKELPVWGVDSDALESVIRCFYTGECSLAATNVVPVMDAAQRLEVMSLANFCDAFVSEVLVPETVVALLEQALHFRMEDLTLQVLQYSERCLLEVTSHEDFLRADLSVVTKLLSHHKPFSEPAAVLKAGWEWLVAETAHNAHTQDIAGVVELPEGMQPEELLDRAKAAEHNITWRQPEPSSTPQAVQAKDEPAPAGAALAPGTLPDLNTLLNSSLPQQLAMLQQAGLLSGPLPLNILMSLQTAAASQAAAAAANAGSEPAANTPMTLAQLLSKLPGAAALAGNINQTLAAELLAQLTGASGAFGLAAAGSAAAKDLLARLTELQQAQAAQQAAQANKASGKRSASAAKLDDEEGGSYGTASGGGGSKRSSSANRALGARGMCQVEGCNTDLSSLRDYHQRYKICEYHLKIPSVMKDGVPQRFCQQCGRFQPLTEFDGNKRSCKARLQRHNDRRRKRLEEEPSGGYIYTTKPGSRGSGRLDDDIAPPLPLPAPSPPAAPVTAQRSGSGAAALPAAAALGAVTGRGNWGAGLTNLQMLAELMNRVNGGSVQGMLAAANTNGVTAAAATPPATTPSPAPAAAPAAAGDPEGEGGADGGSAPPEGAAAEEVPVKIEGVGATEPVEDA